MSPFATLAQAASFTAGVLVELAEVLPPLLELVVLFFAPVPPVDVVPPGLLVLVVPAFVVVFWVLPPAEVFWVEPPFVVADLPPLELSCVSLPPELSFGELFEAPPFAALVSGFSAPLPPEHPRPKEVTKPRSPTSAPPFARRTNIVRRAWPIMRGIASRVR